MTKKIIKQLLEASYTKNQLDQTKVENIANKLSRSHLKIYINALRQEENRRNVIITVPKAENQRELIELFVTVFPDKKIIVQVDPSLLLGVRVKNNDLIYEENLKETLENMLEYLKE